MGNYPVKFGIQETGETSVDERWDIVVAFDIGTSFSGYAYSDRKGIQNGSVVLNEWTGSMVVDKHEKAPTTILVSPDKMFHSFGYDAEDIFAKKMDRKADGVWYRFRHFKMHLHYEKNFNLHMKIRDDTGTIELPALDLFSYTIRYLKTHFEEAVNARQLTFDASKVLYALTVPAIWKESAKKFMCKAAINAGIPEKQMMIVLEPEAAALYCQTLPDTSLADTFKPGSRYVVLDLGGGTVDTIVHDVLNDKTLVEVYKASGGPWGGTTVDEEFKSYLKKIFNEESCLQQLWTNNPRDALELEKHFEIQKRQVSSSSEAEIRLKFPSKLKMYSNIQIVNSLTLDHLYVEDKDFKNFYGKAIENISKHLHFVLKEVGYDVKQVIPVGGFSSCKYLLEKIKEHSGLSNITLCLTNDAGLAVLRGAVLFGYKPRTISSRVSRYTFGVSYMTEFDAKIHPQENHITVDGIEYCTDVFKVLVYEGERIKIDECRSTNQLSSHKDKDRKNITLQIRLYIAKNIEKDSLYYVTDPNITYIGNIVNHPPKCGWPDEVEFRTDVYFGQTCIKVRDFDVTNSIQYEAEFDLPD